MITLPFAEAGELSPEAPRGLDVIEGVGVSRAGHSLPIVDRPRCHYQVIVLQLPGRGIDRFGPHVYGVDLRSDVLNASVGERSQGAADLCRLALTDDEHWEGAAEKGPPVTVY